MVTAAAVTASAKLRCAVGTEMAAVVMVMAVAALATVAAAAHAEPAEVQASVAKGQEEVI